MSIETFSVHPKSNFIADLVDVCHPIRSTSRQSLKPSGTNERRRRLNPIFSIIAPFASN